MAQKLAEKINLNGKIIPIPGLWSSEGFMMNMVEAFSPSVLRIEQCDILFDHIESSIVINELLDCLVNGSNEFRGL